MWSTNKSQPNLKIKLIEAKKFEEESQILNRIYDKGFNLQTMPSVRRPGTTSSQAKPLHAKLFAKNKLEPLGHQPQSTILHSANVTNFPMNIIEIEEKEEKDEGVNNIIQINQKQHQGVISMTQQDFYQQKSGLNFLKKKNETGQIPNMEITHKIGVNSMIGFNRMDGDTKRSTYGLVSELSLEEINRRKYLVDKISGQFNIDHRYVTGMNFNKSKLPPLDELLPKKLMNSKQKNMIQDYKRMPTKLDWYIDLLLKNQKNVNEFIYLQRANENDPYDLKVLNYESIKEGNLREYYTISKKGLCHYVNGKPIEFILLEYWLKERENYDHIKSLKFFTKFRRWKTLKMWRRNVIKHKTNNYKRQLEEKLFILHPILGKTLLTHKKYCCDLEKLRFINISQQQYGITTDIPTLESFKAFQERKRKIVNERIQEFSKKCRENIREGFQACLDALKKCQNSNQGEDEFAKKNENQNQYRLKESAYDQLGFPDNMSYEQRSELRKECSRFLRFSYIIDFIAMESLVNVYRDSVLELLEGFEDLVNQKDMTIIKDKTTRQITKNREPLFLVKVSLNIVEIPESYYAEEDLKEFQWIPQNTGKIENFNINYHVRLKELPEKKEGEEKEEENNEEEEELIEIYDENKIFKRVTVPEISNIWLELSPTKDAFFGDLMKCINEGLNSLQSFERWSRHDDMTLYANVLEEWDDMVGDDWESPNSNFLNPKDWLEHLPDEEYCPKVRSLLDITFKETEKYLKGFTPFLTIFWENSRVNLDIFKNENIAYPNDSLQYTVDLLNSQKSYLENEIPYSADLGLFRIDSEEVKLKLIPSPEDLINNLKSFFPSMLRARIKSCKDWFADSIHNLKSGGGNIDDFVKQQNSLKIVEKSFPLLRSKLEIINQNIMTLAAREFDLKKDDNMIYLDALHSQNSLNSAIQNVMESTEKNLETFANKITKSLIPDLKIGANSIAEKLQNDKFLNVETSKQEAINELTLLNDECKELEENAKKYNHYEQTLNMQVSQFEDLENLRVDLNLRLAMWKSLKEWEELTSEWSESKFTDINTEDIRKKADVYTRTVNKCVANMRQNTVLDSLRKKVNDFKETMPVVLALRNKNLLPRHWIDIKNLIGQFNIDDNFHLNNLMELPVLQFQKEIQEVAVQATQEAILEAQYKEIESKWKKTEFQVVGYKADQGPKDIYVLSAIDELFENFDDILNNLNNILGSRYFKILRHQAELLKEEIMYDQEVLDDWLVCQKNWIYLENIFSGPDIKKKLAIESNQFDQIDKAFKHQMRKTYQLRVIWKIINKTLGENFKKYKETLSNIQKALENYLETKRTAFPRFYFLSNDELLEILAKSSDLQILQKYMKKCFDNIHKLDFGEDPRSTLVEGMISGEGEIIKLTKNITTKNEIEIWLGYLQNAMIETLSKRMSKGKTDYDLKERNVWVLDHPGQVVTTFSQITWCNCTEFYIIEMNENSSSLIDWLNVNQVQLAELTELIRSGLGSIHHKIIVALITQDVHARDIIEKLSSEDVTTVQDFNWQQQLRYYWDEKLDTFDNVLVRQVNASIRYGYEYMGATSRLVITPLTDRCWMTITGALNIKLGASPAGPAGTGKTESTKDLAKALGMLCVVFNCSEQIHYKMMEQHFSGLAQQGAWTCLDEFNRIDIEVLSVIAQQLLSIRTALIKGLTRFQFMTTEISLNVNVGVFITMNPGYAGRTELPDNLKVLFRPVSMMIPDYRLIAEIMLFAEGFENAKPLSQKMVKLYKLSSEQLSQQKHYDFGMRAVKSVLVMAGALKRAEPNLSEDVVLIRAMRDSNVPKFLKEDLPLFRALIQDLFPDVELPEVNYGELQLTIEEVITDSGLQKNDKQITKILQLFETFLVRFGVMLVGFTASSKTVCYQVLQNSMTSLRKKESKDQRFQIVTTSILNPKCISMGELYGEVNAFTQEWQDGLASQIMREAASDETNERKWIVFDGPVDALWIENMNTVLDDNMMLCLANGQRIKLRNEMRILFEVNDLAVASPATVSRCGMVYLNCEDLGWKPYVKSWCERVFGNSLDPVLKPELRKFLLGLFEDCVDEVLGLIRKKFSEPIPTVDLQLVVGFCNALETFINVNYGFLNEEKMEYQKRYINHAFVFGFIWSFGVSIFEKHYEEFDAFIRRKFQGILFSNSDNVYGFYLDTADLTFKSWNDKSPNFEFNKDVPYFNLLVPTIDTIRYSYIVENFLKNNKLVYVTGHTGTGKSVIMIDLLRKISEPQKITPINLIFSAQTSSSDTQFFIEGKLEKIRKHQLGARPGFKNVIFIDDVNMPAVEEYGAQPPIELLRLMIDKRGVFDRKDREWKVIESTIMLACSAPPGGGRNELTQRFTRHFNILSIPQPSAKTLFKIFDSILSGFLATGNFQEQVKSMSDTITKSTIEIYARISKEKLPIPSKFHYTFNLRDVSKVFQGILMCKSNSIRDGDQITRLWIHETSRVFHDRLIDEEDRQWFKDVVIELLNRNFRSRWGVDDVFDKNKILFGDLLKIETSKDYEEIKDLKKLNKIFENKILDYNSEFPSKMNLVFFDYAIDHILRIARILRQPRGNAMLIGVGGSGKQSLTKLASFFLEFRITQLEITKDFDSTKFREYIRELMMESGIEGKSLAFIFNDFQIVHESFLEDINNLLNSGEVPNIWDKDQLKKIDQEIRPHLKKVLDAQDIYRAFVSRVRDNLHIILCMSPVGDALRIRCRKFPSLVDCSTLDWFSAWPADALSSVSNKLLQEYTLPSDEIRRSIAIMCKDIHLEASEKSIKFEEQLKRKVYNTPKSYLDLINLYMHSLDQKRKELSSNVIRLTNGLTKLEQANNQVAQLQIDLTELQPQLEIQSVKVKEAIIKVEKDSKIARDQEIIVEQEADEINKKAMKSQVIADEALAELNKVAPELEKAQRDVEHIDKASLQNVRTYANPPPTVVIVFEGVCILFGKKTDWATAKNLLQNVNEFINNLLVFDKDNIPPDRLRKLKFHVENNKDFNPEIVGAKVPAAKDICSWCLAMIMYSEVAKKVAPKKARVEELTRELEADKKILKVKEDKLNQVKSSVAKLKKESEDMQKEQYELITKQELTKDRLERAEKLTYLLEDEGKRWAITVKELEIELTNLVGDVFLSAACISYCGPFTGIFRQQLQTDWHEKAISYKIPLSENVNVIKTLGDSVLIRDWMLKGLPSDLVSHENAIYSMKGYRWPLLIDPQLQANKWIKNTENKNGLKILKFKDTHFQNDLKASLTLGYPVLIEDVGESLEPLLDPVLSKQFYRTPDNRLLIHFGDSDIDYDENFKLYLTTKIPNPHYLPEIFIKVNIINFTVTFEGLEDQLLADVFRNEQPELEMQRDLNITNLARYKKNIIDLENRILKLLNESKTETLLDDVELIVTLENSKETSFDISEKIKESTVLEAQIEEVRNKYRSVSIRGSILFFVIKDLSLIDSMYQYSLQYISRLFNVAMENAVKSDDLENRMENLIDSIMKTIYTNVCRGLFEAHKLIFSFLIATSINKKSKVLNETLWGIFLRGAGIFNKSNQPPSPDKTILNENAWDLAYFLSITFENFKGFHKHIIDKFPLWLKYAQSIDPYEEPLPGDWDKKLDQFEKMTVVKIFRPEKIMFGLSSYVKNFIGEYYLEIPSIKMSAIYADSDVKTPIIFVLSQGADPTSAVFNFAKEREFSDRLLPISLGQGQGVYAKRLIDEGRQRGDWILLQNCHLAKSWMPKLELILEDLAQNEREVNPDFRLYLTSMPASYFPVSILQNGIKLTTEPPRGIKANLKRSVGELTDDYLNSNSKPLKFHKLTLGLCFFHAIIQERRKFGPLGWNIRYEFNDSDLETSRTVLYMLLNEQEQEPWDALNFVIGEINYGGRVTDDWDRRCLKSILKNFVVTTILEVDDHYFSNSGIYYVQKASNVENYVNFVESLPLVDDPEVFGMHENANINYQSQESEKMINTILSIQPRIGSGIAGKSNDDIVKELSELFLEEMPEILLQENGNPDLFVENELGLIPSLSTVLIQEMTRFNTLLIRMRNSLQKLIQAILGFVVMSQELDEMYYSLLNNQVPNLWEKVAYPSLKPLSSWIRDLKERVKFMLDWLTGGNPNCFWISGLYFPQGFLTGVLQTHARKYKIPIDLLDFSFKVLDGDSENILARPNDGVYVFGLFLEGASWDRKKKTLIDQKPGEMYYKMPVIYFIPCEMKNKKEEKSIYQCPVYKTSIRAGTLSTTGQSTNFILPVTLPTTEQESDYWVLRGTALLTQLND